MLMRESNPNKVPTPGELADKAEGHCKNLFVHEKEFPTTYSSRT